ncbi:MAG TPA: DUF817 domain-containing protein [Acidobacteriaceae bacterium]
MLARTTSRFHSIRLLLEDRKPRNRWRAFVWEFCLFVFKQGWACLFGATLLTLLLATRYLWPHHFWLARYDFLFLAALVIQLLLLVLRMETVREAKVILVFHIVGTCMELFKTSMGSWAYPENNFFRIGHVPLFSGFMYASVGSYMARTARIVDMRYTHYPRRLWTILLAIAIYANFFLHHFLPDLRIGIFAALVLLFGRTWVYYKPHRRYRRMPLLGGFCLVALFIWFGENIGTFANAWVYPNQQSKWQMVRPEMYGSWLLLMVISFVLVTFVNPPQPPPKEALEPHAAAAPSALPTPASEAGEA